MQYLDGEKGGQQRGFGTKTVNDKNVLKKWWFRQSHLSLTSSQPLLTLFVNLLLTSALLLSALLRSPLRSQHSTLLNTLLCSTRYATLLSITQPTGLKTSDFFLCFRLSWLYSTLHTLHNSALLYSAPWTWDFLGATSQLDLRLLGYCSFECSLSLSQSFSAKLPLMIYRFGLSVFQANHRLLLFGCASQNCGARA